MSVIHRIADFMAAVLTELRTQGQRQDAMAASLKSIQDKLADQGRQIDALTQARHAAEQADLDAIDAAVEANGAKIAAALAPASADGTGPGTRTDPATGMPISG